MKRFINNILSKYLKFRFKGQQKKQTDSAEDFFAKKLRETQVYIRHFFQDWFFICLGVASAAFGLKGFLLPNGFIDGGVTGISLLTSELTGISLSILILLINLPFLILGYSTIGKQFAIRSVVAIVLLAILVHMLHFPPVTDDKLLIAAFGGFFLGLGIGLVVRGGAVIDGTEVLAIYLSRKTSITIGDIILIFNVVIFAFGAYVLTPEIALYAMLTYIVASKTVDFIIDGIEEYLGVTIISQKSDDVRLAIISELGRGCTVYNGKSGYAPKGAELSDIDIVYTVVTRLELAKLHTEIDKVDPSAFVIMNSIKDAKGGMIKKRPFKG